MNNELIFITQTVLIASTTLLALRMGKEALVAFIAVQCILANLFVIKQTALCGLTATCADAFSIGAVLGLNLLQEYYGKATAKKTIFISFFLLIFYAVITHLHLLFIPHTADTAHNAFATILSSMPRIAAASFGVYVCVQYLDTLLYSWLKRKFHDRFLVVRTGISIALTQLLDTVLFSYVGLYGIVDNIGEIIVVSYGIKLAALLIALPFVGLARRVVKE